MISFIIIFSRKKNYESWAFTIYSVKIIALLLWFWQLLRECYGPTQPIRLNMRPKYFYYYLIKSTCMEYYETCYLCAFSLKLLLKVISKTMKPVICCWISIGSEPIECRIWMWKTVIFLTVLGRCAHGSYYSLASASGPLPLLRKTHSLEENAHQHIFHIWILAFTAFRYFLVNNLQYYETFS